MASGSFWTLLRSLLFASMAMQFVQVSCLSSIKQVHLALGGKPGEMMVSWLTHDQLEHPPEAGVSLNPAGPFRNFSGFSSHYYVSFHHNVRLKHMQPGARYHYRVYGQTSEYVEGSFVVPDVETAGRFTIAMYGDMGVTNSEETMQRLDERKSAYDFVYHVGDIGYADDYGLLGRNKDYEQVYNEWAERMEPITKSTPYMVCPGNHDVTCHSYGEFPIVASCPRELRNFSAYVNRFRMPFEASKAVSNLWFSFDYKGVHFVSINTEADYPGAPIFPFTSAGGFGDQVGWLEADLKSVDLKKTPWVVVVGHRPMYTTNKRNVDFPPFQQERVKSAFEDIIYKHGVDFYIAGHVHAYERHYPVAYEKCARKDYYHPQAPTHVIVGSAGNTEGHTRLRDWKPDYLAYRNTEDFGYGELTIHNSTVAEWRYIAASTGKVRDSFVLTKVPGSHSFPPLRKPAYNTASVMAAFYDALV